MLRILLVDKNTDSRSALRRLIAETGAECVDGTETSIGQASRAGFDAVVSVDPVSPAVADVPVLHCYRTNPGTDVTAQAIARGASEVLVMPFSSQHLMFKLQQFGLVSSKLAA